MHYSKTNQINYTDIKLKNSVRKYTNYLLVVWKSQRVLFADSPKNCLLSISEIIIAIFIHPGFLLQFIGVVVSNTLRNTINICLNFKMPKFFKKY